MYPPEVGPVTRSNAEKRIFGRLKDGLTNEWLVLHSLGLAGHVRKPWAEIDFVLIGPPGVFCLEVKGGRIAREDGAWLFTDKDDKTTAKPEGPFAQVGSAEAALAHYLFEKAPWMYQSIIGYGVVTPDIRFGVTGPDIELDVVYDCRDEERPIKDYIGRLSEYWFNRKGTKATRALSKHDRESILDFVRGDFDLRPSLRARIGLVKAELLRLTTEQYHVLDGLEENERVLIRGGAGSGKTLLAVEEARRAAASGSKVLICCFNRHLANYLARTVSDLPAVTVAHLHGLMKTAIDAASLSHRIPDADSADVFNIFYPDLAVDAIIQLNLAESYDVLIVDEAQDLLRTQFLDVFEIILKGGLAHGRWRLFLDPRQNIFDAVAAKGMERVLSLAPASFRLQVNCRNTAPIATATAVLSGGTCEETRVVAGPEVEWLWYSSPAEERRLVAKRLNVLLSGGMRPEDVVLLSKRSRARSCLADGVPGVVYSLADFDEEEMVPSPKRITFATVSSYKGLEADVIVLIDVDDLGHQDSLASLYVGASRARALLVVCLAEAVRGEYELRAREYGERLVPAP